jgi:O-antigen ligase/polysaccharide polymerase Wzy-like membrane protein
MNLDPQIVPAPATRGRETTRLDRSVDWLGRLVSHRDSRALILAIPGLIAIATGVILSVFGGGFSLTAWHAAGLFLLALLGLVLVLESPRDPKLPSLFAWILLAYAGFVLLNYLSILWADVPGDAWVGANRALVLGLALAVTLTRPWPRRAGALALALAGFGLLAVAAGTIVVGALGDPIGQFVGGRLTDPAGYANATACMCLMGVFPLIYLAAARLAPWPLRGIALGGATALLQIALLTQSRGGVLAVAVAAIVYLVAVPQRWSSLLCLAVAGALTALAFGTLTDLVDVSSVVRFEDRLAEARLAIALSTAAAIAIGALGAFVSERLPEPGDGARRAGNWGLLALATVSVVAILVAIGNPVHWTEARWDDFRSSGYSKVEESSSRFGGSLGSNRYDFYRVALDEFANHPVAGIGSENFLVPYLRQRHSGEAPHFPHSLAFRILVQFGLLGVALFGAFLVLAFFAVGRALRRAGPLEAGISAAALAAFSVWFAQGLVDWMWAFTGLGVIAFAMLAISIRSGESIPEERPVAARRRYGLLPLGLPGAAGAILAIALAVSLALPGIAARYVSAAYDSYAAGSTTAALQRLDRAADLNFLSAEPLLAKGLIARRGGMTAVAEEAFTQAVEREPDNWFARLELGMSLAARGRFRLAVHEAAIAARLNPRQVQTRRVLARFRRGREVAPDAIEAALNEQLTQRLHPLASPSP